MLWRDQVLQAKREQTSGFEEVKAPAAVGPLWQAVGGAAAAKPAATTRVRRQSGGLEGRLGVDLQLMVFFTLGGRKIALFGRR